MADFYNIYDYENEYDEYEFDEGYTYNDRDRINPYTGKIAKFHMDRWFGQDMELAKIPLNEEMTDMIIDDLSENLGDRFVYNEAERQKQILAASWISEILPGFLDTEFMDKALTRATESVADMAFAEKEMSKKKKLRLKLFLKCIKDYLESLSPAQLSEHRWHNPDYKSPYNHKTRRLAKPDVKVSFQAR